MQVYGTIGVARFKNISTDEVYNSQVSKMNGEYLFLNRFLREAEADLFSYIY